MACMGLAFKPDVDDLRESPAMRIVKRIVAESQTEALVVEPNIECHQAFDLAHCEEAYAKADIVVWLVRHRAFLQLPLDANKIELDFCGIRKHCS